MRSLVVVGALVACGRVGFSPTADGNPEDQAVDQNRPITPPTFVQTDSTGAGSNAVATLAMPAPVTAGNLVLVAIDIVAGTGITVTVTDDHQNAYTVLGPFDGIADVRHFLAYAFAQTSGVTTVTSTLSARPSDFHDLRLHEYAGTRAADPIEATASATGTSPALDGARSGFVTTTEPNELIFGFGTYSGRGAAGTGFTLRSNFDFDLTEDRVAATPGPYEAVSTLTTGSSWTMVVAAIRGR